MKTTTTKSFTVMGLAIRTTNENSQSAKDIPLLWNRFMTEKVLEQLPGKVDNDIYCVYTEYEKDFTRPYTTLLGCRVTDDSPVPDGFSKKTIPAGSYAVYTATGKLAEGVVFNEWTKIWRDSPPRKYTADYEIYGEKSQHPANAEVDIFVAIE